MLWKSLRRVIWKRQKKKKLAEMWLCIDFFKVLNTDHTCCYISGQNPHNQEFRMGRKISTHKFHSRFKSVTWICCGAQHKVAWWVLWKPCFIYRFSIDKRQQTPFDFGNRWFSQYKAKQGFLFYLFFWLPRTGHYIRFLSALPTFWLVLSQKI